MWRHSIECAHVNIKGVKKLMITTKKMTALVAAVASTVSGMALANSAYAAADSNTANDITISSQNGNDSTVAGRTFTAYKIASYSNALFDGEGNAAKVTGYNLNSTVDDEKLRAAIKTAITDTNGNVKDAYKDVVTVHSDGSLKFINKDADLSAIQFIAKYFYGNADDVYTNNHANNADTRKLADALRAAGLTEFATATAGDNDASVSFNLGDDDLGLYLVVETNHGAANGETMSRAMIIGSVFKNGDAYVNTIAGQGDGATDVTVGTIKLKSDKVTVDKEVVGNDQLIGLGSVRTFRIDTNVPNYKNNYQDWTNPVFKVHDNPSDNLTVSSKGDYTDVANLKVQANTGADGEYEDVVADAYTVSADTTTDDANDFIVSLNSPADFSGKKVRVQYDATVNSVVTDTTVNNTNIEFSNDPYTVNSVDTTPHDDERLYQADLDLSKVAFDDNTLKLDGAQFTVTKNGTDTPVRWKESADKSYYYEAKDDAETGLINTVTLNTASLKKGTVFRGLAFDSDDATTYTFTETKAPEGYILGGEPLTFTVKLTPKFGRDGELTGVDYSVNAGKFAKFLDASAISLDAAKPTAGTLNTVGENATGTVYSASATAENTDNLKNMPKTGADVMTYIAVSVAFATVGAALAVVARRRMKADK